MEDMHLYNEIFSEPDLLIEADQLRERWEKTAQHMGYLYPDDTILVNLKTRSPVWAIL